MASFGRIIQNGGESRPADILRHRRTAHRLRPISLLLATLGWLSLPSFAQVPANALPMGGQVSAGQAAIAQSGAALRIDQSTARAVIDWQSFNIGRDASVHFNQPSTSSIALNRVGADGGRSIIDGRLTANGQVWLLNPGGVMFGPTARVDVGGLLAGSLKLGNDDFMSGNYRFGKDGAGSIVNQGTLTAADSGYIALLAPEVRNEGVISARLGTVALASGDELRVDFSGDRLIEIKVDQAAVNGMIANKNLIEADGGWVLMSAGAASNLAAGAINNTGIVRASSFKEHAGAIRLEGGFIALGGAISADGNAQTSGGAIQIAASRDLSLADSVSARGLNGGSIDYRAGGRLIETATSQSDASGQNDGGSIRMVADGGILSSGQYRATGATGQGGRIDLSGGSVRLLSATLDASGNTQGGLVRIGGAFQGGKAQDTSSELYRNFIGRFGQLPDLPHAQRSFINDSTRINVSSKVGAGGTAVVWSDTQTTFLGAIKAKGGSVEVSSAGDLRYVNLNGIDLGTGFLLLDPKDIEIGNFSAVSAWTQEAILGKGYSGGKNLDVVELEGGVFTYPNNGDIFGRSVALNAAGDRLAVGTWEDGFGNAHTLSGSVMLFSFSDNNFSGGTLQAILGQGYSGGKNMDIAAPTPGGIDKAFGVSVSLNAAGDRLAVGANGDGADTGRGAVLLFSFTDTNFSGGIWQATLCNTCSGGKNITVPLNNWYRFGDAVALNGAGDRLAVGARGDDGQDKGSVRLYSFTDTLFSGGVQVGIIGNGHTGSKDINVTDIESGDSFGWLIALNAAGDRLAAGAPNDDGFNNVASNSGAIRLFSFSDGNFSGGTLQATLGKGYSGGKNIDISDLKAGSGLAQVALNATGDRMAVGIPSDAGFSNSAANSGAVRLFSFTDNNFTGGTQQAILGKGYTGGNNLDIAGLEADDRFGSSVALNGAGDRLAVGAAYDAGSGNVANYVGAVYLFSSAPVATTAGNLSFANNAAGKSYMDRTALQTLLSTGSSVTLQANNDITLNSGSNLIVTGSGGNLTLQAGRNVTFNSSITTANGNLTAIAGDPGAIVGNIDPGTPTLTIANGVTLDIGTGTATLAAIGGNFINNAGNSAIVSSGSGRYLIYASDPATSTEGFSSYNKHYNQIYAGTTPAYAASGNWLLYSLAPTLSVAPSAQTVTYGSSASFTPSYIGFIDGDSSSTAGISGTASFTIGGTNSSSGNPVVGAHNVSYDNGLASSLGYQFADNSTSVNELTVNAKPLNVTGISADNRAYDGTTAATVNTAAASLNGLISGDDLTVSASGSFGDKNVGAGKTVSLVSSYGGADKGNYAITNQASTTADITAKALTVSGITASNKVYDGTTAVTVNTSAASLNGLVGGDNLTVSASGSFGDKNVGAGKTVTLISSYSGADKGNYAITDQASTAADIATKSLTVSGIAASNKVYDGTTAAVVSTTAASLNGLVSGDNLTIAASGSFGDKNASAGKTVSLVSSYGGTDKGNYAITDQASTTADIAAKALTVSGITASNKVYDATTAATVSTSTANLSGLVNGDILTVSATGSFGDKNVGIGKTVNLVSSYGGADKNNYAITGQASATANITAKSLAVSGVLAQNKIYDATSVANLSGSAAVSALSGDTVALAGNGAGSFADKNVGVAKPVAVTGYTLSGADAANYALAQPAGLTASITAKPVSYTATVANKTFDGKTTAKVASQSLSGVIAGDSVSASYASANFADKDIGQQKSVTIAGIALSGADGGNYSINTQFGAKADITPGGDQANSVATETAVSRQSSLLPEHPVLEPNMFPGATARPKLMVDASKSLPKLAGVLNRSDLQAMSQQVQEARSQLFGGALSLLAQDHKVAEIADCGSGGGDTCIAKPLVAAVHEGYVPVVKRKIALMIGNNAYRSPIPNLETAINDVSAIGTALRDRLGYEVKVVENAGRKEIVAALNELIRTTGRDDSVMVMYAGHGYLDKNTQNGYWIPADASAANPDKWISNETITRALRNIPAKQVMLVSDSCYSGSLTKEGKKIDTVGVSREQMLTRRSVLAFSSGGEEPVSDEGRDNHSIFAWNVIQSLKQMKDETSGQQLHATIKEAVTKEFPQAPQYGVVISAGHSEGGEYLLTPKGEK